MTPVRARRGRLIHLVAIGIGKDLAPEDLPVVLCGRRIKSPVVEPDLSVTCERCHEIATTN